MASRSHWLTEARTLRTKRPAALRVSICSPTESSAAFPGAKYRSTRVPRSTSLRAGSRHRGADREVKHRMSATAPS